MMALSKSDRKAMVDMLLARGADPSLANNRGETPLTIADNMDTVRALLNRGANVNAKDKDGMTVLMQFSYKRSVEELRLLLENNADVNAKDNNGTTALMQCSYSFRCSVEKLRLLLENNADVNAKTNNGTTALMWVASAGWGDAAAIEALLDASADLHAKNVKGETALMLAIGKGQIEAVHTLLRKGAKVNDENTIGKTPLNYAEEDLEGKGKARTEMMRILKKAGAQ